jgi:hypothetical protein
MCHCVRRLEVSGSSGRLLYRRRSGRMRTEIAEPLRNTGHNWHKHCKGRLFDCEQFSRYEHERGVLLFFLFVCNWKSVSRPQKSREG